MDGEVGHYGEGGAVEEEESALQRKQVHIWPEGKEGGKGDTKLFLMRFKIVGKD